MNIRSLVMKKSWEIRREVAKELGCKPSEVSASIALEMAWEIVKNSNNQETSLTVIENHNNSKSYFKDFKFNHKIEDNNLFELLKMIKNFQLDLVNFMNDFKIRKVFENYFKEIFSDSLFDLINIIGEILHDEKILTEIFYQIIHTALCRARCVNFKLQLYFLNNIKQFFGCAHTFCLFYFLFRSVQYSI